MEQGSEILAAAKEAATDLVSLSKDSGNLFSIECIDGPPTEAAQSSYALSGKVSMHKATKV